MNQTEVYVYGQLLACQAEIEGMKASNMDRQMENLSLAYNEQDFIDKAQELHSITAQLFH